MGRKLVRSANLTLTYSLLRADQFLEPACVRCRTKLDLHQPEPATPHQLLATCPDCHSWYRLEIRPGEAQAVLVALPEVAILIPAPVVETITPARAQPTRAAHRAAEVAEAALVPRNSIP